MDSGLTLNSRFNKFLPFNNIFMWCKCDLQLSSCVDTYSSLTTIGIRIEYPTFQPKSPLREFNIYRSGKPKCPKKIVLSVVTKEPFFIVISPFGSSWNFFCWDREIVAINQSRLDHKLTHFQASIMGYNLVLQLYQLDCDLSKNYIQ